MDESQLRGRGKKKGNGSESEGANGEKQNVSRAGKHHNNHQIRTNGKDRGRASNSMRQTYDDYTMLQDFVHFCRTNSRSSANRVRRM